MGDIALRGNRLTAAKGGRTGYAVGSIVKVAKQAVKKIISKIKKKPETTWKELDIPGHPPIHKGKYPAIDTAMENVKKHGDIRGKGWPKKGYPPVKAEGGRIGLKKGGNGKWMQKVSASIKRRGTKGKCTPITKPGCTGRAKALAKTFKKIAARRKAA